MHVPSQKAANYIDKDIVEQHRSRGGRVVPRCKHWCKYKLSAPADNLSSRSSQGEDQLGEDNEKGNWYESIQTARPSLIPLYEMPSLLMRTLLL